MKRKINFLSIFVFVIYLILLTWVVLFKLSINVADIPQMRSLNFIPYSQSLIINGKIDYSELIWNAIFFVPLGMYLMMFNRPKKYIMKIASGLVLSVLFETAQYIFAIGGTDITDVINNTIGVILGTMIYWILNKLLKHHANRLINYTLFSFELFFTLLYLLLLWWN